MVNVDLLLASASTTGNVCMSTLLMYMSYRVQTIGRILIIYVEKNRPKGKADENAPII